ncbi:MAG: RNA pseudouridine synthase [Desulfovibrio sp. S3730MH75]|nr:MAG: RNA pseudouridine synthase [Desulfovibrio sp. S3730MH75]
MNHKELLDIVYSDTKIVVVNKPSGLLSVPGLGPEGKDCVVTRVQEIFPDCRKFPTIHRLDMDTSGLIVMGFTARAVREIVDQFQKRQVKKRYVALLDGIIKDDKGVIEMAFRLDPYNRPYQVYDPIHGKLGITEWRKIGIEDGKTRIEFTPRTGRTHQLRVHSAHPLGLNCPIVGDRLYGTGTAPGQLKLHAGYLSFMHPKTKEMLEFELPPLF